jgi:ABC-type transport system substrate-binding protein
MERRGSRGFAVLATITLLVAACDSTPPPSVRPPAQPAPIVSPAAQPSPASTAVAPSPSLGATTASASASPASSPLASAAPYASTLVMTGLSPGPFDGASSDDTAWRLLESGLYRDDDHYDAVPDLAAQPCVVSASQLVVTCKLVTTTFQDGAPLTADDVVYTYELRRRPTCVGSGTTPCLGETLASVSALNGSTVQFTLAAPSADFLTDTVTSVRIEERRLIEQSFAQFLGGATAIGAKRLAAVANAIDGDLAPSPPDCQTHYAEAVALVRQLGTPLDPGEFPGPNGQPDPCGYLGGLAQVLHTAAGAVSLTGLDQVAAAYPILAIGWHLVGTGPFRMVSYAPGREMDLEAFSGYHFGQPVTERIRLVGDQGFAADKAEGVNWIRFAGTDSVDAVARDPAYRAIKYPAFTFTALQFNLATDEPFADVHLRQALALCIDKPRIVRASVGSSAEPLWSIALPGSWAYEPNVPHVERDVAAGRALIESAGWRVGADGIYEKNGMSLSAAIVVRADSAARVHFVDLVAQQARDCGMDLHEEPEAFGAAINPMINTWPHIDPGTKQPFALYFGGFQLGYDPAGASLTFASWTRTSKLHTGLQAGYVNYIGYDSAEADRLIRAGMTTADERERARDYQALQLVLARDVPYLFGFANDFVDVVSAGLTSVGQPLDAGSAEWAWQLEDLAITQGP